MRAARAPLIATLDGDGQNDPADIPRLIAAMLGSSSGRLRLVMGNRTTRRDTWLRRVSSRVANGVRGTLLRDGTPDTGCGIKVFDRAVFLDMPRFDHMHRFMPALFRREGYDVVSVPVNHRERTRGRSKYGVHDRLWVGIVDLVGLLWLLAARVAARQSQSRSDLMLAERVRRLVARPTASTRQRRPGRGTRRPVLAARACR